MAIVINSAWDAQQYYKEKEEARKHINSAWDAQMYYQTYGGNGMEGNWGSREWVAQKYGNTYVYSPATRSWTKSSLSSFSTDGFTSSTKLSNAGLGFNKDSTGSVSQSGAVNSKDASSNSKTGAEKEYIDIEFNTLTGDIEIIPTKSNMKLKVGCTVVLNGVGKYLSGLYFVSEIRRKISKDNGYSMSLTLFKNGFGDSLKSSTISGSTPTEDRFEKIDTTEQNVNYNFQIGDKVRIVGDDAIYSNAHQGVKVPNWVKQKELVIDAFSSDGNRARLKPIWSWTYIKFLQKI